MKVLQLVSGGAVTGAAAAALTDARALLAAGHRVWVAARAGSAVERACAEARAIFAGGFYFSRGPWALLRLPSDLGRLRAAILELELDVVHAHRSDEQLLACLAAGRGSQVRIVRSWHRTPPAPGRPFARKLARACAACCCVAREHVEILRRAGARAEYLPAGVDTKLFAPAGAKPSAPPLHLGLIARWKNREDRGARFFLDLLARLDAGLEWRGVLLGRGEGRGELEAGVASHPQRARLAVVETNQEYARQVAGLDLGLVMVPGRDGASRPAVELLACGVPILAADRPGLRELAEDASCARLLPPEDPRAWVGALEELLREPERLAAMSAAARRRAESVHSLAARGAALARLYDGAALS